MTQLRLLSSGASPRGWSRIGCYFKCPQLYSYLHFLRVLDESGNDGYTRGSMGHTGLGHELTRMMEWQQAGSPGRLGAFVSPTLLPWRESIMAWCQEEDRGWDFLGRMTTTVQWYLSEYPEPSGEILAVEQEFYGVVGWKAGEWGLWAVQGFEGESVQVALDGSPVTPALIDCPGHPEHGAPMTITRRLDCIVWERAGVWVDDHKFLARSTRSTIYEEYALDGQFAAARALAGQALAAGLFGERARSAKFLGARVNAVCTTANKRELVALPRPWSDLGFATDLYRREQERVVEELRGLDQGWWWRRARHGLTCRGRFKNDCPGRSLCIQGPPRGWVAGGAV